MWVSALWPRDANHAASVAWMAGQVSGGARLLAPRLVLPEVSGPMARITGVPESGVGAVRRLLATPGLRLVELDRRLMADALVLAARLRLRGADAVYVATARRFRVPLVTWDQQLGARAGQTIQVLQPRGL